MPIYTTDAAIYWTDTATGGSSTTVYATTSTSDSTFGGTAFVNELYGWLAQATTAWTTTSYTSPAWPQLRQRFEDEHEQLQRNMVRRMQNRRDNVLQDRMDAPRAEPKHSPGRKARALLLRNLDRVQRHQLRSDKFFELVSSSGRRMRIRDGTTVGNVDELDANGRRIGNYCAHPMGVPLADGLLTQKLALEVNDDAFFAVANRRAGAA